MKTTICCGVAALLVAGCADSPVSPAAATPQDPHSVTSDVHDAGEAARGSVSSTARALPNSAAGAGAAGKTGMRDGAAAAGTAAGKSAQSGPTADDDAGAAGAAGMPGHAGAPSVPVLTGNDVYLEEGVRPTGVRRCYTKESNNHPAILRFRQVFYSSDYAARDSVIEALEAASKDHPGEEQYTLFLGLAYLWRLKEPHDLVNQLRIVESALNSHDALERAYALCPTDHRIPGWLGPIKIIMGDNLGDTALRDDGIAVLRQGIEHYPNFVLFSYVMIYADLPPDDPQFKQAVAEFRTLFSWPLETSTCNGWMLDPACLNTPTALYNVEAGALYAGDMYARAQDREAALGWYTMAKTSPEWAHPAWDEWRYRDLLETRIRTVDQRMKAASSSSTSDDLESVWNSQIACTICHAK